MEYSNVMQKPRIEKVVVNIGVGESGEKLVKAETLLERLTDRKPVRTVSKHKIPVWKLKTGDPIGCKVTLRGKKAEDFLIDCFKAVDNEIKPDSFDEEGNLSFGIPEYIDFPRIKYDPEIGIFGVGVSVSIERPGYRIKRRRVKKRKIPSKIRITREESIEFFMDRFKVDKGEE